MGLGKPLDQVSKSAVGKREGGIKKKKDFGGFGLETLGVWSTVFHSKNLLFGWE